MKIKVDDHLKHQIRVKFQRIAIVKGVKANRRRRKNRKKRKDEDKNEDKIYHNGKWEKVPCSRLELVRHRVTLWHINMQLAACAHVCMREIGKGVVGF